MHITRKTLFAAAAPVVAGMSPVVRADDPLRISEMFWDGPSSVPDSGVVGGLPYSVMYIELRGTPGMSLDNHYLMFVEGEDSPSTSNIDSVFNLSGFKIGTNGFTLLLPNGFNRTVSGVNSRVAPGTEVHQTTGPAGAGRLGFGEGGLSGVGHTSSMGVGDIENGGFSAFLIHNVSGAVPTINTKLDLVNNVTLAAGKDGELDADKIAGWTFLDSIGQAENGEEPGYAYAKTYFTDGPMAHVSSTTTNIAMGLEVEHLMRYGSSTDDNATGWTMINITDDLTHDPPGYNFDRDGWYVSGPHTAGNPPPFGELVRGTIGTNPQPGQNQLAREGTLVQNSLGRANWPVPDGDLSQNTVVDQADLTIVLQNWLDTDTDQLGYWLFGDPSGDGTVNQTDLDLVMTKWPLRTDPTYTVPDFDFLSGDTNLNGVVDVVDLNVLASKWQQTVVRGYANGDFTYDGFVDIHDLFILATHFDGPPALLGAMLNAMGVAPSSVPEPGVGLLAGIGMFALQARRRRTAK